MTTSARQLWGMLHASKATVALSVLAGLIAGGSTAGVMTYINRALENGPGNIAALASIFFGLCFISILSGALSVTLLSRITQDNLYELRLWLCRRILATPFQQIQRCGLHRITAALTEDIGSVATAQQVLPDLFIQGSKLIGALVYLGVLSPKLLMLVLVFILGGLFCWRLPTKWAWRSLELVREAQDVLFGHFRAVTEGYKELKLDARRRHAFLSHDLSNTADILRKRHNNANLMLVIAERWSHALYFILIGAGLFLVSRTEDMPREALTGFTLVVLFIGEPLSAVVQVAPIIGKGVVALKNLEALGLTAVDTESDSAAKPLNGAAQPSSLELLGISYKYKGDDEDSSYRLGPLSLHIAPGELVFITGGNGSGKTTLALLILGLYVPDEGSLKFGGELITDENREAYRQNFSAVFADSYVFDSLLGYTSDDVIARANELLVLLQLDTKLQIADGRFSTVDLSRGQRKRLALLTAYLADRPYYVFDEWAAEQDPEFRDVFYLEMLPELKARGKTVIVITHDDRYFYLSDRLLRLTMGQLDGYRFDPDMTGQIPAIESSHV
ncbi:cyclic peptide export ABC transporter [Methylocystis bryophila]|nr:cyclic peptide export ABC transporter [Methylocystis bryophila]BDV41022.1 ABC transporter ATP-binding protein [Methylocystis bryophila]